MFESDQHEFDEEYAEISHPAPPLARSASAVATIEPPVVAVPVAATLTATKTTIPSSRPIAEEIEESEEPEQQEADQQEFVDPAEKNAAAPPKKKPNLLLLGGFAALAIFAIFAFMTVNKPKVDAPPPRGPGSGDCGSCGPAWASRYKMGWQRQNWKIGISVTNRADGRSLGWWLFAGHK